MRQLLCFGLMLFSFNLNAQRSDSDYTRQFIKWNVYSNIKINYVPEDVRTSTKFTNVALGVRADVSLDENDIYDASSLFLQIMADVTIPADYNYVNTYSYNEFLIQ